MISILAEEWKRQYGSSEERNQGRLFRGIKPEQLLKISKNLPDTREEQEL